MASHSSSCTGSVLATGSGGGAERSADSPLAAPGTAGWAAGFAAPGFAAPGLRLAATDNGESADDVATLVLDFAAVTLATSALLGVAGVRHNHSMHTLANTTASAKVGNSQRRLRRRSKVGLFKVGALPNWRCRSTFFRAS